MHTWEVKLERSHGIDYHKSQDNINLNWRERKGNCPETPGVERNVLYIILDPGYIYDRFTIIHSFVLYVYVVLAYLTCVYFIIK